LQQLLYICEDELHLLDLTINPIKSACIRIGPCYNARCSNITTDGGHELTWCEEIRYLGISACHALLSSHMTNKDDDDDDDDLPHSLKGMQVLT